MTRLVLAISIGACWPILAGAAGEIAVDEEFLLLPNGPGNGIQATPHVAFGRDLYLVVWREGWHGEGGNARIFAARVSPNGEVVDRGGIEVAAPHDAVQERPRVAFGGGVFLVVWQEFRNGKDYDILAARVSPEGKVLDAQPIVVAAGPRTQVLPDVASDGTSFLVAWQGLQGDETKYRGFATPVTAQGKVGAAVETGAAPQAKLAWGGTKYLAVYGVESVYSLLLDSDGNPLNPSRWGNEVFRMYKSSTFSVSAVPGQGWLVVCHRSPPDPWGWGGPGAMRCALVDSEGKLANDTKEPSGNWALLPHWLDIGGRERTTWPHGESASAWDGRHSVVVWQRWHVAGEKKSDLVNCDLFAARVDGWRPVDEAGVAVTASNADETLPNLASDGKGALLCVYEKRSDDGKLLVAARRLSTA